MRTIFGIVLGVALTVGAAFFHDNNVPDPPNSLADRQIVNWDVLGAVVSQATGWVSRLRPNNGQ